MPDSDNHGAVRIGDLVVDANARSVTRDGREIDLPRLSFDLLLALIEAAPGPVSGDELMARVFGDAVRAIKFFRFGWFDFNGVSMAVARSG